jgi:hypothetical protein
MMARWAEAVGCAKFFGYDSTARDADRKTCLVAQKAEPLKDKVFGIDYGQGVPEAKAAGSDLRTGILITAFHKNTTGCRANVRYHTCFLRPVTVRYDVRLTNDSISLLPPSSPEAQDPIVAETPPEFIGGRNWWPRMLPLLFPTVRVYLAHAPPISSVSFSRYINCVGDIRHPVNSNTMCSMLSSLLVRDLSLEYLDGPESLSALPAAPIPPDAYGPAASQRAFVMAAKCNITWRDPMPVGCILPIPSFPSSLCCTEYLASDV